MSATATGAPTTARQEVLLSQLRPGELVAVLMKVPYLRARNRRKAPRRLVSGRALELERADETPARARREPSLDQAEETGGIADHVGEQPIDRSDLAGIKAEGALAPDLDAAHCGDPRVERRFVDADDVSPQAREHPGPSTRAAAEIEAAISWLGKLAQQGQRLPQLQVRAARRCALVLDEERLAVGKRTRAAGRRQQRSGIDQGPGAQRRGRRGRRKDQRLGGDLREFCLD